MVWSERWYLYLERRLRVLGYCQDICDQSLAWISQTYQKFLRLVIYSPSGWLRHEHFIPWTTTFSYLSDFCTHVEISIESKTNCRILKSYLEVFYGLTGSGSVSYRRSQRALGSVHFGRIALLYIDLLVIIFSMVRKL